jgi:hypothetical protein
MEGNTLSCNVMSITEVGDATVTESTAVQVPAATCLEGCDRTMKTVNEESSSRVLVEPDLVTTPQPSEVLTSDLNSSPVSYGRFLIVFVGRLFQFLSSVETTTCSATWNFLMVFLLETFATRWLN